MTAAVRNLCTFFLAVMLKYHILYFILCRGDASGAKRSEASWHERLSRDVGYEEQQGGFPLTVTFPRYTHGNPALQDETITYQGSDWPGAQETVAGGSGATSFTEDYSLASVQPSYEPPQAKRPGSSLLSLANILQRSNPPLRSALLRQFLYSLARLRTRYVGLGGSVDTTQAPFNRKNAGSNKEELQAATERQTAALAAKLTGVIGAAGDPTNSDQTFAKFLLVPFGKLLQEAEGLLSDIAMQGDATQMIIALHRLAPPIIQGLSYLEAPQSQGASGVLEPVRDHCLKRVKELDKALLDAQADLDGVLLAYPRDFDAYELQREKQLAALEGGQEQDPYIPPVYATGIRPDTKADRQRKGAIMHFFFAFLIVFTIYTAISVLPPEVPIRAKHKHRRRTDHSDDDGGDQANAHGGTGFHETGQSQGTEKMPMDSANAYQEPSYPYNQQWAGEQGQTLPNAYTPPYGGAQGGAWGAQGSPWAPGYQGDPYGAYPHRGGSAYEQFQNFQEEPRVVPSAPPLPDHFEAPPEFPPPSYAEAVRLGSYP
ncbi:LOW QUALITY PROTEIN: uncharacterized protein EMH_0051980 [Eimeria mitis]|uniref:Uncharacterized protein n=1 Tax=Eimeria mitis TaxID=44415 RepID=U6JW53_9EIME|nr:LOW QUALITY PROTEIN: uncharacterized protein EMH_0051980 [Eimeria mitis]CDJ29705.1 hypothetical protein, conserved [Eimeria mitis]